MESERPLFEATRGKPHPIRSFGHLGRRLLLWLLVVSLIPLVLMAYQGYHCARQALVDSLEKRMTALAESKSMLLEERLDGVAAGEAHGFVRQVLADSSGLGSSGKVYLIDDQGAVVQVSSGPLEDRLDAGRGGPAGIDAAVPRSHHLHAERNVRGEKIARASSRVSGTRWFVVVEESYEEALGWLSILKRRAVTMGLFTLGIVILVSLRAAGKLTGPLRELAQAAQRVGSGRLDERVTVRDKGEIGAVGHAFNKMLDELETSRERLVRASSLAAVGELSAVIVHEIRNPLSSIKMNLQALKSKVAGDEMYAELAEIAAGQVGRMEQMLTGLLNYGKPMQITTSRLDVFTPLREAVRACTEEASANGVHIALEERRPPVEILGDGDRLADAFVNLLRNAIHASAQGGEVTVSASTADASEASGKRVVEIRISDQGPGLQPSQFAELFKPFYSTKENGIGLGLATVKKIVELHNGRIDASNRAEGGGASFRIELPTTGTR